MVLVEKGGGGEGGRNKAGKVGRAQMNTCHVRNCTLQAICSFQFQKSKMSHYSQREPSYMLVRGSVSCEQMAIQNNWREELLLGTLSGHRLHD